MCSLFPKRKGDLLLVRCEVDLDGIEDKLLVWLSVLVGVFVRLEVAFYGHEIALLHEFELGGVVFAAPCLDIDENGLADFGTVHGFLAADREREAGYAGLFKVIDCCIYCYETTHCEIVFHLFHIRCFFEVNNQFLRLPSQVVQIKGAPWNADEILFFYVQQNLFRGTEKKEDFARIHWPFIEDPARTGGRCTLPLQLKNDGTSTKGQREK